VPAVVAIAVVSWNTRDLLDACLRSLEPEHAAGRAEVWVVDNGSSDGSAGLVRDRHPWATLVEQPDNPGFGAAVNVVASQTSTPWIAAANADITLEAGALGVLLAAAERAPGAGILAPRLVTPDGALQHSVHPFPGLRTVAGSDLGLARLVPGLARRLTLEGRWAPSGEQDVDWAHGAFLLVRRSAWDAIGGFDPSMWLYAEDLDLCWRAARTGARTRYVPAATVVHHVSAATSQAFGEDRHARAQAAAYAWMGRRLGRRRATALATLGAAAAWARAGALGVAARVRPAAYGWRRDRARAFAAQHRAGLRALRGDGR